MVRLLVASACLALFIIGAFADKEYAEHSHDHGHHHHHDGHNHHDHASHVKFFSGDEIAQNEADQREKLRNIATRIDVDQNGQISREELRTYVEQRTKEQQVREADELISSLDPKDTNKISFDAYIKDTYGDDVQQLEKNDKSDPRSRETRRTYLADKQKWTQLDKDNDQTLTYEEFRKFLRPEDDEDLRRIEITSIIKEYDADNDGKISPAEYLKMTEAETGQADTLSEELDTNKDGFGDYDEFARYYLPTSVTATDEETEHLLKECDTDKNSFCSPDEIVKAYSSFAGSQVTDFGADLEAGKEEL